MSVDLPAPFSPTKALTSPDRISKSTSFRAITPGNDLDMPRATSTGSIDEPVVPTAFEGICDSSFIRFVLSRKPRWQGGPSYPFSRFAVGGRSRFVGHNVRGFLSAWHWR